MIKIIQGMGIYYDALRRLGHGAPSIVRCRGDEDRMDDRREAYLEQEAVDKYLLPPQTHSSLSAPLKTKTKTKTVQSYSPPSP